MDPFAVSEPSSTEPESNIYNDNNGDFEKVDPDIFPLVSDPGSVMNSGPEVDQYQEHEVTTTAYGGEEAEEDRYFSGASGTGDNLLNFNISEEIVSRPSEPLGLAPDVDTFSPPAPHSAADYMTEFASKQNFSDFAAIDTKESLLKDVEGPSSAGCTLLKNLDPRDSDSFQPGEEFGMESVPDAETAFGGSSLAPEPIYESIEPDMDEGMSSSVNQEDETETYTPLIPAPRGGERPVQPKSECHPNFLDLIYWRDVRKTGVVFGSMMFLLLSLACCSLMSVTAYLSLALLTITLSFRVYKNLIQAVQKSGDQHPFKPYLDMNISISEDRAQEAVDTILKHVNNTSHELRRLFLIEDIVDSIKFGLLLWVMTYIGAWFNGMTLVILTVVSVFTLPKFYETYKTQIDSYVDIVRKQVNKVVTQIQEKVPMLKKKTKTQ